MKLLSIVKKNIEKHDAIKSTEFKDFANSKIRQHIDEYILLETKKGVKPIYVNTKALKRYHFPTDTINKQLVIDYYTSEGFECRNYLHKGIEIDWK